MTNLPIYIPQADIAAFCQKWQVVELALFGSVLRDDFTPDSDIDVLVTHAPNVRLTLFDYVGMMDELSAILGRKVDIVSRHGLMHSRSDRFKDAVLQSARVVHRAA